MTEQLDQQVAEHVMGWLRFDTFRDQARKIPQTEWFIPGHQHPTSRTPKFSTDIAAAWQIVERMRKLGDTGWAFEIKSDPHPGIYGPDYLVSFGQVAHSRGPNVAEAICLAALQALRSASPSPSEGAP